MRLVINTFTWQVLRAVLRSPTPPVGRSLRLEMTRRTQDGSFLAELVGQGLLRVVKAARDPFAATYALTPVGEHAAEYGEVEFDHKAGTAALPAGSAPKKGKGSK